MTHNPQDKTNPAKFGYTLESHICLTPNLSDELHTHIAIHIEATTTTTKRDEVLQKAYQDFKALMRHLQDEDGVPTFEHFIDSIFNLSLHQVMIDPNDPNDSPLNDSIATHICPEKIQ